MDQSVKAADSSHAVRIMHGALVAGLVLVGGTFFLLRLRHWRAFGSAPTIGIVLTVVGVGLLAVVLRRTIPARHPDQAPSEYWATAESRGAALVVWSLIEAAGLLGWVGYVLTGSSPPAVVAGLAIGTLIFFRPSRLEGAGAA